MKKRERASLKELILERDALRERLQRGREEVEALERDIAEVGLVIEIKMRKKEVA